MHGLARFFSGVTLVFGGLALARLVFLWFGSANAIQAGAEAVGACAMVLVPWAMAAACGALAKPAGQATTAQQPLP